MENKSLENGFRKAKKITKYFAKTFFLASLFLPKNKRFASYCVYAICRISDESVDNQNNALKIGRLNGIKEKISAAYSENRLKDNLLLSFRHTVTTYGVPKEYFDELIAGMLMDITKCRYKDFNELHSYCYRVAGIVGLIMLKIFSSKEKAAEEFALDLGIAMQLTNILRDIKEDCQRGRIYLPLKELDEFQLTEKDIENKNNNDSFKAFMDFQINRCREYYKRSKKGIRMIPGVRQRLVVIAMREMYAAILTEIKRNKSNVFTRRAQVNIFKKILIILKVIIRGEYLCV